MTLIINDSCFPPVAANKLLISLFASGGLVTYGLAAIGSVIDSPVSFSGSGLLKFSSGAAVAAGSVGVTVTADR